MNNKNSLKAAMLYILTNYLVQFRHGDMSLKLSRELHDLCDLYMKLRGGAGRNSGEIFF